jgi:hypothetical protein
VARAEKIILKLLAANLLAILVVALVTAALIYRNLPGEPGRALHLPAAGFIFEIGSGSPVGKHMRVDRLENGYALLSSGPVSIHAEELPVLSYAILPPGALQETTFFWRRSDDAQNVKRTAISAAGERLIDLSLEPEWRGEIIEFGFLLSGVSSQAVQIGGTSLLPDSFGIRLKLAWQAWISFEGWSQQSINFLYGGDPRQVISLPLLISSCLLTGLLFFWVFSRIGTRPDRRHLLTMAGLSFLVAWILLDIRWTANNIRQILLSTQSTWQNEFQQQPGTGMDQDLYQYTQRLKNEVIGGKPARILIVGSETAADYFLLKAKYHLLPHNALVSGRFAKVLAPESLDFVIYFGEASTINSVPGWNSSWNDILAPVDQDEWGVVFRVR